MLRSTSTSVLAPHPAEHVPAFSGTKAKENPTWVKPSIFLPLWPSPASQLLTDKSNMEDYCDIYSFENT